MQEQRTPSTSPYLEHWGRIAFEEAWARQKEIQQQVIAGSHPGVVAMCEHPPTVTAGSSTQASSFVIPPEELTRRGIDFYKIERGGDLTFHGPGQLVCYPLLNLNELRRDVHWYMRALEAAIIATCQSWNVNTERIAGRTGVWIVDSGDVKAKDRAVTGVSTRRRRKVASIGVRLSRWCSMHGLSLNVLRQPSLAGLIVPCGLSDIEVTSLEEELSRVGFEPTVDIRAVDIRAVDIRAVATPGVDPDNGENRLSVQTVATRLATALEEELGIVLKDRT